MRVLVVEDYEPLRETLTQGLREAGFAVDATGDGDEGLWYAQGNDYDVVVLDLLLPGTDGLTLLRRLREAGRTTHVLIITAKGETDDKIRGLDLGADDYLAKPFALGELIARVRALARRKYGTKDPVLRVADLEIDTVHRTAERGGERIELTPREYALLTFLAVHAGEVVTRTMIWEHIYEFASTARSNVVDVYVGHLRRKLERPGLPRLLHTRRGHGYVLGELP
jgi:DNA-binding response OmpR family regulator